MRFLFWKALIGLLLYDLLGFGLPRSFRRLHKFVQNRHVASGPATPDSIERVCKAMNYACVFYCKHVLCLQRSTVTTWLLRNAGVAAQMVVGTQEMPFKAHAWVEVDGRVINEITNVSHYIELDRC
jgi:hypothetical protein